MKQIGLTALIISGFILSAGSLLVEGAGGYWKLDHNVATDQVGNVYVITDEANHDVNVARKYVLRKYDKQGKDVWERENVPVFGVRGHLAALAVGSAGSVHVTCRTPLTVGVGECELDGFGGVTTKYDSAGNRLWAAVSNVSPKDLIDPIGIAVDSNSNVYVTGRCGKQELVIEIESTLAGAAFRPNVPKMRTDVKTKRQHGYLGRERVEGSFFFEGISHSDIVVIKYDGDGRQLWTVRFGEPGASDEWPVDIAVDSANNIYIAGGEDRSGLSNFLTLKYDGDGRQIWAARYSREKTTSNMASALVVDGDGNVYVMGSSMRMVGCRRTGLVTVKYDTQGKKQWEARYRDPEKDSVTPNAVTLDKDGNIYVTAYVSVLPWQKKNKANRSQANAEFVIIKYDTHGKQAWIGKVERPEPYELWLQDVKSDANGNVYLIGFARSDTVVVNYDSEGNKKGVTRLKTIGEFAKFLSTLGPS